MDKFNGKIFRLTLLLAVLAELMSFYSYFFLKFNGISFFIIAALVFSVSLVKLEYGFYALLAELFIGSKGHLFYLETSGGSVISIRLALFLIVMIAWLINIIKKKDWRENLISNIKNNRLFHAYFLLMAVIGWGIINGIVRGNGFPAVFFDANGWLFFGLFFVFFAVLNSEKQIGNILQITAACLAAIGLQSLVLLIFFAHRFNLVTPDLYQWANLYGLAEITKMARNFYRIFSQAQIYSLVGFFIFFVLGLAIFEKNQPTGALFSGFSKKRKFIVGLGAVLSSAVVLISFSRSFWLGGAGALLFLFCVLKFKWKNSWQRLGKIAAVLIGLVILEITVVYFLVSFPKPQGEEIAFTSLLTERLAKSGSENASLSRFNLLGPLFKEIVKHPLIGSGFGAKVSYKSLDLRNIGENPGDLYTTYSFEWGYLDIWLKLGLVGLAAYGLFIWEIWRRGWGIIKVESLKLKVKSQNEKLKINEEQVLVLGMMAGLVALLATHIASPYLNHPLGVGYLLLCGAVFEVLRCEEKIYPAQPPLGKGRRTMERLPSLPRRGWGRLS